MGYAPLGIYLNSCWASQLRFFALTGGRVHQGWSWEEGSGFRTEGAYLVGLMGLSHGVVRSIPTLQPNGANHLRHKI